MAITKKDSKNKHAINIENYFVGLRCGKRNIPINFKKMSKYRGFLWN